MRRLNFPPYCFDLRADDGQTDIFDPFRRKYVRLTPEEWVRQHLLRYLIEDRGCPQGLTAVETGFSYAGAPVRADIIVHNRQGRSLLLAECKAPGVRITDEVFDQLARYNTVVGATYLVATNGIAHYCCKREQKGYRFLQEIPRYGDM